MRPVLLVPERAAVVERNSRASLGLSLRDGFPLIHVSNPFSTNKSEGERSKTP